MDFTKEQLTAFHKKNAVDLFNETWDLIDKSERTHEETLMMLHKAHASVYHWSIVGNELNQARGEWQVSYAYSLSNLGEGALLHGKRSLDLCLNNNIKDFDLAFGYSSVAHAHKILGNTEEFNVYYQKALDASSDIAKKDDKDYFLSELEKIKK